MQLYRFTNQVPDLEFDTEVDHEKFAGTRGDAKDFIKTVLPTQRQDYYVELIEVPTTKEAVLNMLNTRSSFKVLKRWKFTSRGGLRECDNTGKFIEGVEL